MPSSGVYCGMVLFVFLHIINLKLQQLNCVLDGHAKNGAGNSFPNFLAKDYSSIYNALLMLIKEIARHPYHSSRLAEHLSSWAREGQ